ncbi:beta-ketoacyl synthase domain-containing protein [Thelonectria olida]|uniref:Beta-ketoacyl synthase domain-containing protein n=1 Tax=Thelonectria olida TaxID=1576542 RepID=A0A9P9AP87_9HYPO|nr:beta-ketoacyl synthase domain-containing protein [Thelonectria olida]
MTPHTTSPSTESGSVVDDFAVKVIYCGNEFPSDDLHALFASLQRHGRDANFPFLSSFLSQCVDMLRREIALLPHSISETLPPFQNLLALATHFIANRRGALSGALDGALLCAVQVGMLIGHPALTPPRHHESQGLSYTLDQDNTKLGGLSIGLLSGAAVSLSSSLADLCCAGVEAARVAFRLGVHVDKASQQLEPRNEDGEQDSWAYVVTELSEAEIQEELDAFNSTTCNPDLTKVFISASDSSSVSVTGPPSRLKSAFLGSQKLRYSRHFPLPVFGGLCHASHIYTADDIRSIVQGSTPMRKLPSSTHLPLISPQKGKPFESRTPQALFEEIVSEILTGTIYLDKMNAGLSSALSLASSVHFMQFSSSIVSKRMIASVSSDLPDLSRTDEDLLQWSTKESINANPSSTKNAKLAVVGMSCRLPGGANNNELFWKLMEDARDVHTTVPADRFDIHTHFDPTGKTPNATETPYGNFIDNPGFLDAGFFNMSPREAEQTDPMHRLALVTAYEALEMSGYSPNRTPSTNLKRIGTYYGQASDDWRELNAGQDIGTYAVPGGERAFANGRINYFFKFGGPSFNIDTACSSGLAAVHAACSALWAGEADTVLAGGLNVITNPDNYCMLCKGHFLSKTGQCKVWDKGADGYCRADGIASVVIKRLEDAEADNDNIIAVIASGATNHSADALSITQPHAGAQMENYAQVMSAAGVSPLDVSYVELHGTGTQVGDAIESESVIGTFAPPGIRRRPEQRLHLSAVKSNLGHSEAAAGITSLLKVLLVYQKGVIPPHVGIKTEMNPVVVKTLDRTNAGLVLENTPWPKPEGKKRYALVNSFGAHGGNTTILLEDAPDMPRVGQDPRATHVFPLSAKSKVSLRANAKALIDYLEANPDTDLGDLSYTLCARRIHHPIRIATSATSISQLNKYLESSLDKINDLRAVPATAPAVVMTFTGQGAFYQGISSGLYGSFPAYRSEIQHLDALCQKLGIPSILPYIENATADDSLPAASPMITQVVTLVVEIALTRFWQSMGVVPSAVIGHSLGEYAAAVAAGILSAADAIFLVSKRAQLLEKRCTAGSHVMLSVRASVDAIAEALKSETHSYEVSCQNGAEDTVISGKREDISAVRAVLDAQGKKATLLEVPYAFHSTQLDPMLDEFEEIAKHVTFKTPSIPFISPLLEDCVFDGKTVNANYLRRASREPVLFAAALEVAKDMGIVDDHTLWVNVGPHPICSSFVRNWTAGSKTFSSLRKNEDNFATLAGAMAGLHTLGIHVAWNEYFRPYERAHKLLTLESYKWNEKNYWLQYEGTWTLDKAFPHGKKDSSRELLPTADSSLMTSSIHRILSEEVLDPNSRASLIAVSDLKHPSLVSSVTGHMMNGFGVATTSIWADMAMTVGEHLYKLLRPATKEVHMNVGNIDVLHAQVINPKSTKPHLIQTTATLDLATQTASIEWHSLSSADHTEPFATCTVTYEDPTAWEREWDRISHLISSRADELSRLASTGTATRLNRKMAYTLFGNVVDYADKYRGMQSVVQHDFEAVADITLAPEAHGVWHSAPHFIDSVFHVGGLILNGGGVVDARDSFYVTHGWGSCRMLDRFVPGASYKSYSRMAPTGETNMYSGDVYVLQDGKVVGMMGDMRFRRIPRVLMNRFFSPSEAAGTEKVAPTRPVQPIVAPVPVVKVPEMISPPKTPEPVKVQQKQETVAAPPTPPEDVISTEPSMITDCLKLISRESGLDMSSLTDEASFVELGVDSLMSLVLSEKFRSELQLEIRSSLFLECANIAALKEWLTEYC